MIPKLHAWFHIHYICQDYQNIHSGSFCLLDLEQLREAQNVASYSNHCCTESLISMTNLKKTYFVWTQWAGSTELSGVQRTRVNWTVTVIEVALPSDWLKVVCFIPLIAQWCRSFGKSFLAGYRWYDSGFNIVFVGWNGLILSFWVLFVDL